MHRIKKHLSFFVVIFFWPCLVLASEQTVVINEICWMGNNNSANNEWIELYNNSGAEINLSAWKLSSQDESINIALQGKIPGYGYFLLERTDDQTVSNVIADQIYTGALSNNGEYLKLTNSENNIVDEINCQDSWFAGDNKTKQTMERKSPIASGADIGNWQTSQVPDGTPKATNSIKQIANNETLIDSQRTAPESVDQPILSQIETGSNSADRLSLNQNVRNIFINEIMPSPEGSDAENEWIELYNANNFETSLAGWKIQDKVGVRKTYNLPSDAKIHANGFLVLTRQQTKISLNNEGDGLEFLNPNEQIIDSIDYEKAKQGQSWSKTETNWQWSLQATPGKSNIITILETKTATSKKENAATSSSLEQKEKSATAQIGTTAPKNKNVFAIMVATLIAAGSAFIAWVIKKKVVEI